MPERQKSHHATHCVTAQHRRKPNPHTRHTRRPWTQITAAKSSQPAHNLAERQGQLTITGRQTNRRVRLCNTLERQRGKFKSPPTVYQRPTTTSHAKVWSVQATARNMAKVGIETFPMNEGNDPGEPQPQQHQKATRTEAKKGTKNGNKAIQSAPAEARKKIIPGRPRPVDPSTIFPTPSVTVNPNGRTPAGRCQPQKARGPQARMGEKTKNKTKPVRMSEPEQPRANRVM